MSNTVLVIGQSGSGKSTSLRNLDPKTTFIINVLDKPLPFKAFKKNYRPVTKENKAGNYYSTNDWSNVVKCIEMVNKERPEITTLVIDDWQYILAYEFMRRVSEKGFDKFSELANHGWSTINACLGTRANLTNFILAHSDVDNTGRSKCKTIGKMLDEKKICLRTAGLTKIFGAGRQSCCAVDHVDMELYQGEVVSIVGESGSGKTTLAKMLLGLISSTDGEIYFEGKRRDIRTQKQKREYWKNIQAIFQDPFSSFNIFHKVDSVLLDCISMRGGRRLPRAEKIALMTRACSFVNLKFEELTNKYPFELSGGQMQRLMIARIFLLKPKILLADEPTSMIDSCSRATILDMLMRLRNETGMTVIFITHDIGLAYFVSDKVFIMEHGKFVESGSADEVILHPKHPYTQRLINDVPKIYEEWDLSTV